MLFSNSARSRTIKNDQQQGTSSAKFADTDYVEIGFPRDLKARDENGKTSAIVIFFSCFPKIHNDICFNEDVRPTSMFKSPCNGLFLVLHQVPMWLWFHKVRIPLVRMKVMINLAAKFGNHAQTDMLEIIAAHNGNVLSECSSLLLVPISGISIL